MAPWRRHCISGVESESKPPSSRRDGQLHSVIRYLFDSGIITMHCYHGNQQKGHIAKA
jgi:hypothetical protein